MSDQYGAPQQPHNSGSWHAAGPSAAGPSSSQLPYPGVTPPGVVIWPEKKKKRRFPWGVTILVLLVAVVAAGSLIPLPYVIESPGPTYNTIGQVKGQDVLQINGHETFAQNGNLDLTTVYLSGGPNSNVSGFELIQALMDNTKAVYNESDIFPKGITQQQSNEQNAIAMTSSQEDAVAAALNELKISYEQQVALASVSTTGAANGKLQPGDEVLSVDGKKVTNVNVIRDTLAQTKDKPVAVVVSRNGKQVTETVTPTQTDGRYVLGVTIGMKYKFPFTVDFKLDQVGGPSAGMMFALGLIGKLSTENLTGGKHIAGTGTITPTGDVGPIGGIAQKLVGARNGGATLFLAPSSNCGEVAGHVPNGLEVKRVDTLGQALQIVKDYAAGKDLSQYPTCTAK